MNIGIISSACVIASGIPPKLIGGFCTVAVIGFIVFVVVVVIGGLGGGGGGGGGDNHDDSRGS